MQMGTWFFNDKNAALTRFKVSENSEHFEYTGSRLIRRNVKFKALAEEYDSRQISAF